MMLRSRRWGLSSLVLFPLISFSYPGAAAGQEADSALLVLAGSSLTNLLPGVGALWEEQGGMPVRFSFDATSRLAPQTLQGISADVFFSADSEWMDWLQARGGIRKETRVDLLGNALVVVVPRGSSFKPRNAEELAGPALRSLAMAGENVPAGRYGQAALEAVGGWVGVADRVVRAGNVRGALEWVAIGEAEAGVVYRTDAWSDSRVEVAFTFSAAVQPPITYPAAVLSSAPNLEVAADFLAFCRTQEVQRLFREAGFLPPPPEAARSQGPAADTGTPSAPPGSAREAPGSGSLVNPWSAVRLSFLVAFWATLAGLVPALWLGWILARREFFGKSVVATLILVPLVLPPVVTGFLLLSLLGTQSLLGGWLASMGLPIPFTLLGATMAALVVGFPLYVVSVRNAFQTVDPRFEEVSWTLGRHRGSTFLRVTLPLALPGVAAGGVLAFARALGEFGATVILAGNVEGNTRTIALAVYTLLESPQGREAIWMLVAASVVLSLLALLGYEVLSRRQRRQMEVHHAR